jgi:transposase
MPAHAEEEGTAAIMRTQLAAAHVLLSDPGAAYHDLGPGYYEQQADGTRRTRGHIRSLERLGW